MKTPITSQGLPPYIYGWEVGPNEKVWSEAAVREALAAQAATIEAICKIIECAGPEAADEIADLLGYPSVEWPSDQAASSPATAVDAVDEREAGHVGDTRFEGWLSESVHKGSMYLKQDMRDSYWAGYQERAALQASRQPQAQQGVAAPLELKVCHSQNASQTPQTGLSLMAAPQEWSPAYTRGPARQSAPVAAVPALVPLSVLQYNQIPELCQIRPSLYESVVRAIEAAIAKINGLTVGDGAQPIKDTP